MATNFQMPKLGLTMEEGTIVQWLVPSGGAISPGDAVLVVATDKVETEVEAVVAGLLHHRGAVGDTFPCGAVIGVVVSEGEAVPAPTQPADVPVGTATVQTVVAVAAAVVVTAANPSGRLFASPNARRVASKLGVEISSVRGTGPNGRVVSADVEAAAQQLQATQMPRSVGPRPTHDGSNVVATVAARNLADLLGVDIAVVQPDAREHRVTRDGVADYVRSRLAAPPAITVTPTTPAAPALPVPSQQPTRVIPLTGMRGTIAKRMHASLHQMAQLTLTMDADVDALIAHRNLLAATGDAPGFTDYVVAATARALKLHPAVNAQVTTTGIALLPDVHVGLAVAVDNGLMVPVVRHADRLTLAELALTTKRLAAATRSGSLSLADLEGGTFSVTALGMFGVNAFTPVINAPNVAILGVGRIRDEIRLTDGAVTAAKVLTLSLTWDHRVLDGAPAAEFCRTVVGLLAKPDLLD